MKKVILIPDSFKGTMSSSEICQIMRSVILEHYPECDVKSIPVADGGEGKKVSGINKEGMKFRKRRAGPVHDRIGSALLVSEFLHYSCIIRKLKRRDLEEEI